MSGADANGSVPKRPREVHVPVDGEGVGLVPAGLHGVGPEAHLSEVGGEVVGGHLQLAHGDGDLPVQGAGGLGPSSILIPSWQEGEAPAHLGVVSALVHTTANYGFRGLAQSDYIILNSLENCIIVNIYLRYNERIDPKNICS